MIICDTMYFFQRPPALVIMKANWSHIFLYIYFGHFFILLSFSCHLTIITNNQNFFNWKIYSTTAIEISSDEYCAINVLLNFSIFSFEKGCKLSDQGDHCQAILAFDKAINLCPKIVTYYLARGESYLQICDFQSAILNLKRACVLEPNNDQYYGKLAFVYYFYGQTLFDQNLFAEALEAFSRASEMRPEVVGYHTRRWEMMIELKQYYEIWPGMKNLTFTFFQHKVITNDPGYHHILMQWEWLDM